MFPGAPLKDMNDDIPKVHEDPMAAFGSFEAEQAMAFVRERLVNVVRHGHHLAFGVGRAYDEEVSYSGSTRNI
jgi:hypothetical protein